MSSIQFTMLELNSAPSVEVVGLGDRILGPAIGTHATATRQGVRFQDRLELQLQLGIYSAVASRRDPEKPDLTERFRHRLTLHQTPRHDEERWVMYEVEQVIEATVRIFRCPTVQLRLHRAYPHVGLEEVRPRHDRIFQRPPHPAVLLRTRWTPSPCTPLSGSTRERWLA